MLESKHVAVTKAIDTYLEKNLMPQLEDVIADEEKVKEKDLIDILGALNSAKKQIEKVEKALKSDLKIDGRKEIFGNSWKAKISISQMKEVLPSDLQNELSNADFLKCVKVIGKALPGHLTEDRIKQLSHPAGIKESVKFERTK